MAVRTTEEIMASLRERMGEDTADEALEFIADVQDTLNAHDNSENENWKQKYEENDKEWRQKYRDRFFSGQPAKEEEQFEGEDEDPRTKYTYEKLFKEVTE